MIGDPVETARRLAVAHPAARLPCPVCVNPVNAGNLEGHLAKVHPGARAAVPPWRGRDRRIAIVAAVVALGGAATAMAITLAVSVVPGSPGAYGVMALPIVPAMIALAGLFDVWRASLVLDGDVLVLRHSFVLRRRVGLVNAAIEIGALLGSRGDVTMSAYADEIDVPTMPVRAGSYVRIAHGRRGITIAAKGASPFAKIWDPAGWRRGRRRRWCDIVVTRDALVALEYELAARGLLRLPHT